jgi:hypothetical protein
MGEVAKGTLEIWKRNNNTEMAGDMNQPSLVGGWSHSKIIALAHWRRQKIIKTLLIQGDHFFGV